MYIMYCLMISYLHNIPFSLDHQYHMFYINYNCFKLRNMSFYNKYNQTYVCYNLSKKLVIQYHYILSDYNNSHSIHHKHNYYFNFIQLDNSSFYHLYLLFRINYMMLLNQSILYLQTNNYKFLIIQIYNNLIQHLHLLYY